MTGLCVLNKAQKIKWRHCLRSQSASSRNHTETLSKNSSSRRELGNLDSRPGEDVCLGIVVEALGASVLGCKVRSCPGWSPRFLWALKIVCVILLPSSSECYRRVWLRLLLSWWRATGCVSTTPQWKTKKSSPQGKEKLQDWFRLIKVGLCPVLQMIYLFIYFASWLEGS